MLIGDFARRCTQNDWEWTVEARHSDRYAGDALLIHANYEFVVTIEVPHGPEVSATCANLGDALDRAMRAVELQENETE